MIEKDLVFYNLEFDERKDLLSYISKLLFKKGYVKEAYEERIIEREEQYPTGLMLNGLNIAICHADPDLVNRDAMFIVKLAKPVEFRNAENFSKLDVELVIGLVLSTGTTHLRALQRVAQLLLDKEVVDRIKNVESETELVETFDQYFKDINEG